MEKGVQAGPVGVLADEGFQELEFWYPVLRLREEGIPVVVIGPREDAQITSQLGYPLIAEAVPAGVGALSALIVPGGAMATRMMEDEAALGLIRRVAGEGGLLAASGRGREVLEKAGVAAAVSAADADGLDAFFPAFLAAWRRQALASAA